MAYLGNTPTTQSFISGTDYFNGTGAQTAFTLSRTVASVNDIQAVVNNVVQVPNDAYTISGTTITFTSAPSAGTNNVYVRYLSTTTQAITPSQGTVSWNTLDSNVQGDLGISFKNRIINSNMVIDQRNAGASVTPTSDSTYTLDRWKARLTQSSKYSVQQNAGSVTPPAGFTNYLGVTSLSAYSVSASDFFVIQQVIEGFNVADLGFGTANAKTITISFWVRSSLTGTFGGSVYNDGGSRNYPFTYTISSANTWEQKSITIAGDTSGTWATTSGAGLQLQIGLGVGSTYSGTAGAWSATNYLSATGAVSVVGTNGATFYITGVQLEVGTQATTFTTAGGSYGAELALCYRYCYALYKGDNIYYATAGYYTSTDVRTQIQMPVNMRTTPTISYTGYSQLWRNGTSDANNVNGWSVTLSCPNTVHLTSTNSMSGTAGQIGWLYGAGGGQLIFLAEL
jgi:hypothetical protein